MPKFQPGQSGNKGGRPTKEMMALRAMTEGELATVLRKLKRASGDAVALMIAAMHNPNLSESARLKYAKDVYDLYLRTLGVDSALKRSNTATPDKPEAQAEAEIEVAKPVFKLTG